MFQLRLKGLEAQVQWRKLGVWLQLDSRWWSIRKKLCLPVKHYASGIGRRLWRLRPSEHFPVTRQPGKPDAGRVLHYQ